MKVKVTKRANIIPAMMAKSIQAYNSAYELIDDYTTAAEWEAIPDGLKHFLQFFDAFEGFTYYVLNRKTVTICDGVNGDIISEGETVEKFIADTLEYGKENNDEEMDI